MVGDKPPLVSKPEGLGELQILLIICALLFLALMLFGVACSYYCLKQRNIKLIRRRRALSSGPGSVVTKMSESTLQLPMFDGLKIPRAHPPSNSGSDQALIVGSQQSDTLPSDYPSESRSSSEIEEGDTRSLRRPSTISSICQQEVPIVHQEDDRLSSVYSDAHPQSEFDMVGAPTAIPPPTFDVAFRVTPLKRKSPSPPSSIASDDSRVAVMRAQERQLSTILEKEEWRQSGIPSDRANVLDNPDLNQPALVNNPPTANYAQVNRKPRSVLSDRSIPDHDTWSVTECEEVPQERRKPPEASFRVKHRAPSVPREPSESEVSTKTLMINDDVNLHTSTFHHVREDEESEMMIVPVPERPVPPPKLQEVDDLYLRNVTDKRIVEENERIRRQMLEYHQRPPPNWDVTIRKHPPVYEPRTPSESTAPDWDVKIRQYPPEQEPRTPSESTWDMESQPPPEWDVKIRQYPPLEEPRTPSESTAPDWDVKIRQYPPLNEPRTPSESTAPDWDVNIRQYPPLHEPRSPSQSTMPPDWNVKIRQYPPKYEPRTPSESTNWDAESQPPPDWDVNVRQYPPLHEPRSPSQSTLPPDWDVKIRQYPPKYEPRSPSESTDWDRMSQPPLPPNWDVSIRQYPPVHEPRTPSDSTDWDGMSQTDRLHADDLYLRTITERHVTEEDELVRRQYTEYRRVPKPRLPPNWDVTIRQHPPVYEPRPPSDSTADWASDVGSERPPSERPPINWNVLIRVLQPPVRDDDISSVLTEDDRDRWHHIITTESVLRTMLTEATVREDFERIRYDTRFERIFEPRKWDVIIRVLAPPNVPRDDRSEASESTTYSDAVPPRRYRKRSDASRRSGSLAPVREGVPAPRSGPGSTRSGRSSVKSGDDVRSLTETTVNFAKYSVDPDAWSQSSGHTYHSSNYPRSMADRSHSEVMEHGAVYRRADWDEDSERMSRPSLARSTSEFTENNWSTPARRVPFDRISTGSGYSSSSNRKPRRLTAEEAREASSSSSPHDVVSDGSSSPREFRRRVPYERVSSSESEAGTRPE